MTEDTEDSKSKASAKKKHGNLAFYLLIIPTMMISSFFLVTKVINPHFAPSASSESADMALASNIQEEGYIYELGPVLVNPSGAESRRFMKVGVSMELDSRSPVKKIEKAQAKLQHQLIMILSSKHIDIISSPEGKSALQEEIKNIFISELGLAQNELKQVYFSEFVIQ